MLSIATANPAAASASRSGPIARCRTTFISSLRPRTARDWRWRCRERTGSTPASSTPARQTGHLFQGRFGSVALDEEHVMNAARYVALNPVRARLVQRVEDWPHSSVRAHLGGRDDGLVSVRPLIDRAPRFADLIEGEADAAAFVRLRRNELIGRPLGSPGFVAEIENRLGRTLAPGKRGRKPRNQAAADQ